MPRPGPRPYECIRRAWHSESHQALRGGLTQEIFRIVTEFHRPDTRCKKEWQEKLPIVVLRAEEILYSKARTEAEYVDLTTLKERLNDAVNTMIRRTDESREREAAAEGPFMEPCVEAALSLGCAPKVNPRGLRSCSARISSISTPSSLRRTATTTTTTSTNPIACPSSSSSSSTSSHSCSSSPSSSSFSSPSTSTPSSTTTTSTTSCITTSANQPLAFLSLESASGWSSKSRSAPPQVQPSTSIAEATTSKCRPPCFATTSNMVNNHNINCSIISGLESQGLQRQQLQQPQQQQHFPGFAPNLAPSYPLGPPGERNFRLQREQVPAFADTCTNLSYLHNKFQRQQNFQHHHQPAFPNVSMVNVYIPQVQVAPSPPPFQTNPPPGMFATTLQPAFNTMQPSIRPRIQHQEEHDLDLCLGPPKPNASSSARGGSGRHLAAAAAAATEDILSSSNTTTLKKAKIVLPL